MNKPLSLGVLAGLSLLAPTLHAQEVARVISSVPAIQQVAVPRQVCNNTPVLVEQPRSGAGALLGAIAGGAAGNAIGGGSGRVASTMLGVIGGAALGDRVEGPNAQWQQATHCSTQTFYENRTVGYNVTYEYAGKQYSAQMPYDPGPTVHLQFVPTGAPPATSAAPMPPAPATPPAGSMNAPYPAPGADPSSSPPIPIMRELVVGPPPVVYATQPYPVVYPAPYYRPYFVPNVSLHLGYVRGGHRRHWH